MFAIITSRTGRHGKDGRIRGYILLGLQRIFEYRSFGEGKAREYIEILIHIYRYSN